MKLQRTINYGDKTIRNDDFILTEHKTGKGTCIFVKQVLTADKLGFKLLTTTAVGGTEFYTFFNGHITWAKVGYSLIGQSLIDYTQRLSDLGIEWMPIHLFLQAKNIKCANGGEIACGYTYWTTSGNGFPWDGEFDTQKGSPNRVILHQYVAPKILRLKEDLTKRMEDLHKQKTKEQKEALEKEVKDREKAIGFLSAYVDFLN